MKINYILFYRPLQIILSLWVIFSYNNNVAAQAHKSNRKNIKSEVKIVAFGSDERAKFTLTPAIKIVLTEANKTKKNSKFVVTQSGQMSTEMGIKIAKLSYESSKAKYLFFDCPKKSDSSKMISFLNSIKPDCIIIVVDANNGPMPYTKKNIQLASRVNSAPIIIFLNKMDLAEDPELLELVEMETRELLSYYGFNGDEAPLISGSTSMAYIKKEIGRKSILQLLNIIDTTFQNKMVPNR